MNLDDHLSLAFRAMSADDPAEITAQTPLLAIRIVNVCHRGPTSGIQIAHDKSIVIAIFEVLLECDGAVGATDPRFIDENNVARVGVSSKHETVASPWSTAKPQFEMRLWVHGFLSFPRTLPETLRFIRERWTDISRRVLLLNHIFNPTFIFVFKLGIVIVVVNIEK